MEAITIVIRSGLGMQVESVRPYLKPGTPIAIGRGGAVIADVVEVNTIEDMRLAGASAAGYIDSVERYMESASNLESVVVGLESALICIESCAINGQSEPLAALRRIREITTAFLDNSGARVDRRGKPSIFDVITGTANLPPEATQLLPTPEEHAAQIERVAADLREHGPDRVTLKPCAHCGGPPVPFVQLAAQGFGSAPRLDNYGDDGLSVEAFVYCHECGANGPKFENDIFDASDYDQAMAEGVRLWQDRDGRHADLYEANAELNLFPRLEPEVVDE